MRSNKKIELNGERTLVEYSKSVLSNNVRVVTEYIPTVRSASIGIWIDSGSRDENPDENGISHFLEHTVFKGTEKRNLKAIATSIESVGGYLNAFTGKEQTCYYARVLDENIELAVDVLSDLVLNALFPSSEIEKEKLVVLEELKDLEDDPDDLIHDIFELNLFKKHNLGLPVLGNKDTVCSFTKKQLIKRCQEYYTADRMVVAAAGNIHHNEFVLLVEKYLKNTNQQSAIQNVRIRPEEYSSDTIVMKRQIQQAHVCMGKPTYSIKSEHRFALQVLNTLLGEGMSSRLFQHIREKLGYAYSIYSFMNLMSDVGSFGVYLAADARKQEKAVDAVKWELERLCKKEISASELSRTKMQFKGNLMLGLENIPNRMMRLGSSELIFGHTRNIDDILKDIDAVTVEDVQTLAKEVFNLEDFTTVLFLPS